MELYEVKSCGVVPSYYTKKMQRRILQACNLKHSIKKGMFSILDKMNLLGLGRGEYFPLFPLATRLLT